MGFHIFLRVFHEKRKHCEDAGLNSGEEFFNKSKKTAFCKCIKSVEFRALVSNMLTAMLSGNFQIRICVIKFPHR